MHLLDLFILVILIIAAVKGYRDGALRQLLSFVSWVISIALANRVVPYLAQYLEFLGEVKNVLWASWLIGFLLCMVVCSIGAHLIRQTLSINLGVINRILGGLFGVMVATLFVGLLLNIYEWIAPSIGAPPIAKGLPVYTAVQLFLETFVHDSLFEVIGKVGSTTTTTM